MLRSRNPPPWPGVKRFLFPSQRKKRGSFAWLNLEDAGEVLPLSSLWIREFTGYNPCILTGPGQGMGRQGEVGDIGRENGTDIDTREIMGRLAHREEAGMGELRRIRDSAGLGNIARGEPPCPVG